MFNNRCSVQLLDEMIENEAVYLWKDSNPLLLTAEEPGRGPPESRRTTIMMLNSVQCKDLPERTLKFSIYIEIFLIVLL